MTLVLAKNIDATDLITVTDFFRFQVAISKGMIMEQITYDSLNTFAEQCYAGDWWPSQRRENMIAVTDCIWVNVGLAVESHALGSPNTTLLAGLSTCRA
jgi:hypothetical protein